MIINHSFEFVAQIIKSVNFEDILTPDSLPIIAKLPFN